jgi:hypothetical protein
MSTELHQSTGLVQLVKRRYRLDRAPRGQEPVFDLQLGEHEQVVGVAFEHTADHPDRQTVDHVVWVWIAVRL